MSIFKKLFKQTTIYRLTRIFVVVLLLFSCFFSACNKNKPVKLLDDLDFKIAQKYYYENPDYKEKKEGPVFQETYIDDPEIKTLKDLRKYYPLITNFEASDFEAPYYSKALFYKIALINDSTRIPVIVDEDGLIYDFLIEDGWLGTNTCVILYVDGKKEYVYPTLEVEKRE